MSLAVADGRTDPDIRLHTRRVLFMGISVGLAFASVLPAAFLIYSGLESFSAQMAVYVLWFAAGLFASFAQTQRMSLGRVLRELQPEASLAMAAAVMLPGYYLLTQTGQIGWASLALAVGELAFVTGYVLAALRVLDSARDGLPTGANGVSSGALVEDGS